MRAPTRPGSMRRPPAGGRGTGAAAGRRASGGRSKDDGAGAAVSAARPRGGQLAAPGTINRVSTQLSQRLAERRRALRRMRLRTIAIALACMAGIGAVVYLVGFSSVLALHAEEVEITGASEVVDTAAVAGVVAAQEGQPLIRLSTGTMAEEVRQVSGVLDAEVTRQWPRGLSVHLTPRTPVATVPEGEEYLVLDAEAVQLDRVDEPREDLPVVEVDVGSDSAARTLQAAVSVLGQLPPALFEEVEVAAALSPDQVELTLADGALVVWGSAEESDLKVAVLDTLRQVPAGVYDVSAPRHPITRD